MLLGFILTFFLFFYKNLFCYKIMVYGDYFDTVKHVANQKQNPHGNALPNGRSVSPVQLQKDNEVTGFAPASKPTLKMHICP